MSRAKKRMGRPPIGGEAGQRYQVHLAPTVVEKLREVGDGSLSRGIVAAGYRVPDKPKPPKSRYVVVTDPEVIEAIKRASLTDPRGGVIDGMWFAETDSLTQFRGGTKYKVKA